VAGLTFAAFLASFIRVRDPVSGAVDAMRLHPEQRRFVAAMDARDGAGGRQFREFVLSWPRKAGKSATAAAAALYCLTSDPFEADREVAILSADLQQSKDAVYAAVRKMRAREPWLQARIRLLSTEAVFTDEHGIEHVLRILPKDPRGIHGLNLSALIADECWVHDSWDLLEGVSPSPARRNPLTLWTSYAGLRHQRQAGVPWYDVLTRAQAGDDPQTFLSHITGRAGALDVPWITEAWLDRLARQFEHVPAKFQRLALNQWAAGDAGAFLSAAEVADAVDGTRTGVVTGPATGCTIGVDLGLSHDTCAIVASRADDLARLIVEAVEIYRGTKSKPVSLMHVEDRICALAAQLGTRRVVIDRWQAALLSERLSARGLHVRQVTSDAKRLDEWATSLKRWFTLRAIRVPQHAEFLEQLEGLEGEELRRRDRIRFTATGHHRDDAAVALCLSAMEGAARIGQQRIAEMPHGCAVERALGRPVSCFLFGAGGFDGGDDPLCRTCPGFTSAVALYSAFVQRTGEDVDLRTWYHQGGATPNDFVTARRFRARAEVLW
jgi:phage terminase large subunit-like protein